MCRRRGGSDGTSGVMSFHIGISGSIVFIMYVCMYVCVYVWISGQLFLSCMHVCMYVCYLPSNG